MNARVEALPAHGFDIVLDTVIVGAGACGLVAGLAAAEAGQQVLILEADRAPAGSTALSAGLIPAAGTALQRGAGIEDNAELFASDIQRKAHSENDPMLVETLTSGAARVIDWLADDHALPFSVVDDFDYPGHSRRRMHGLPTRSGRELMDALRSRCEAAGVDIVCDRRASVLYRDAKAIRGVGAQSPDRQALETLGCRKLILACNGFGGNRRLVSEHMPEIEDALWFGHSGNQGEAVEWGRLLGAKTRHLGAYQGHGNVAHPHGILITWAVITEGGIQVNAAGQRFWNEAQGYSEAARAVLGQPGGFAVTVFDSRGAAVARQFEDFKQAESVGAIRKADTLAELAASFELPEAALRDTLANLPVGAKDAFGRLFDERSLASPYYGVRVTGALFHTQGGLSVNSSAQVCHEDGWVFANLYAGGGAACGVSGSGDSGYLSGNGLLSALVLGYRAGIAPISADL
ncbi:MAG: FAD-dependent oxidoreductase [Pseudomonadota bacterium]